jgi:hypothetical protein
LRLSVLVIWTSISLHHYYPCITLLMFLCFLIGVEVFVMEAPIPPDPAVEVYKVVSFVLRLTFIPLLVSIFQCEKRKKRRKTRKRGSNRLRKRGCRADMQRRQKGSMELEGPLPIQADIVASPSVSQPNNSVVVDLALSDEDTVVLQPSSPPVEVLDTSDCPKVRLPGEIPAEVLDAHMSHHYAGEKGISLVVRSWCVQKFWELNPGVSFFDFDFI